jgi:hypothetical protein
MDHVLLLFKPSPAQQSDLDHLLAAQQNPTSTNLMVPRSVTAGVQPVVVTVGGVSNPSAYIHVP